MNETRVPTMVSANGEMRNRVQQIRLDSQLGKGSAGRSGASWLPWILTGLLALTWAGTGIRSYGNMASDGANASAGPAATAPASSGNSGGSSNNSSTNSAASAPTIESGTVQLEVKGYIVPAQQIAVSPIDVGGRLVELNVVEGKFYKKGEVLAKLDPSSYLALYEESVATYEGAVKRLRATEQRLAELKPASVRAIEVTQLQAQLDEAKAQQDRTLDDYRRLVALNGNVAARELEQAETDNRAAQARVVKLMADLTVLKEGPRPEKILAAEADRATASADVDAAEARKKQSKWRLDNCTIVAPIAGTVLAKKAEQWNLVNPMAFGATSGSVCDMANLADLEVELEIPERDISKLKVNQPCRIKADAYPGRAYEGRLDRIMPIANRSKSIVTVRVKVTLPSEEAATPFLKPEMGAVVSFLPVTADKK